MNGYGKPGYTREEFEREMDAELDEISSLDREYQPGGIMANDPVYADRRDIGPVMTRDQADAFISHMSTQEPARLEQDRTEAWGLSLGSTLFSPDAMVVTFDREDEKR